MYKEVVCVFRLACHLMMLCVCIKCHKNALNGFKLQCGQDGKFSRRPIFLRNFAVSIKPRKSKSAKYFHIFEKLVLRN